MTNRQILQRLGRAYQAAHALIGVTLQKDLLGHVEPDSDLYKDIMSDLDSLWDRKNQLKKMSTRRETAS